MGAAEGAEGYSDAAGGCPAGADAPGLALKRSQEKCDAVFRPAARPESTCFFRNASGATAIEYTMVAACIAVVIVTVVTQIGQGVLGLFSGVHF
jgi:Flp pilus assembly pilin Flp